MHSQLENLGKLASVVELKKSLLAICSAYGVVTNLEVLVAKQVGKRRALCFLGMQTVEQEQVLMRELQLGQFGGDVIAIIELDSDMQPERDFFTPARPSAAGHGEFQPTLPIAAMLKPSSFSALQHPDFPDFPDTRPTGGAA